MKFKALAVAAAMALSSPAFAEDTSFTGLTLGSVTNFGGFLSRSGEIDTFTFGLATPAAAAVSVFNLSIGPLNDITDFYAEFQGTPLTLTSTAVGGLFIPIVLSSFTAPGAPATSFSLLVSGKGPAAYSGSFVVSSVPEPGSVALMLAGLGVLGFVSARRRKNR